MRSYLLVVEQHRTQIVIHFFFQAEDGIRYLYVTGVQTCALPIFGVVEPTIARLNGSTSQTSSLCATDPYAMRRPFGDSAICSPCTADDKIGRASCRERV